MLINNVKKKYSLNSMFSWYPCVEGIVPTPRTVIIPQLNDFESLDDKDDREMLRLIDVGDKAAQQLGGYPVFLRSDYTSNKHDWLKSCYVTSRNSLRDGVNNIFEFTLMVDTGFNGIVVREFLDLPYVFKAFYGLPISQEFRYFIKNGEIICRHPYWIPSCMRRVDCEDWLPKLQKIMALSEDAQKVLDKYALTISKAVEVLGAPENFWSLDFCYAQGKGWVFTDMAVGADSEHYATCPNADPVFFRMRGDPNDVSKTTTLAGIRRQAEEIKRQIREGKTDFLEGFI